MATNWVKREAVYNAKDYVGTRVTASWRLTFNRATQTEFRAFDLEDDNRMPPVDVPPRQPIRGPLSNGLGQPFGGPGGRKRGRAPSVTVEDIRSELMQPRQVTGWWVDGNPVILAPNNGHVADAAGGPFPQSCDIVAVWGPGLFLVDYVVEFMLNDTHLYSQRPNPILSNAWEQADDLDANMMTTRVSTGVTVFHAGLLFTPGLFGPQRVLADEFRQAILPPIPSGFKREKVHVKERPDGVTLDWTVVDREVNVAIGDVENLVTDVQASHSVVIDNGTSDEMGGMWLMNRLFIHSVLDMFGFVFKGLNGGKDDGSTDAAGKFVKGGLDLAVKNRLKAIDDLRWGDPTARGVRSMRMNALSRHIFNVKISGKKLTNRAYLERLARDLIRTRLAPIIGKKLPLLLEKSESTYDLAGPSVSAHVEFLGGPIDSKDIYDPLPQATLQKGYRPEAVFDANPVGTAGGQATQPVLGQVNESTYPTDGKGRESALTYLMTQALSSPYDAMDNLVMGASRSVGIGNPPALIGPLAVTAPDHPPVAPRI